MSGWERPDALIDAQERTLRVGRMLDIAAAAAQLLRHEKSCSRMLLLADTC